MGLGRHEQVIFSAYPIVEDARSVVVSSRLFISVRGSGMDAISTMALRLTLPEFVARCPSFGVQILGHR